MTRAGVDPVVVELIDVRIDETAVGVDVDPPSAASRALRRSSQALTDGLHALGTHAEAVVDLLDDASERALDELTELYWQHVRAALHADPTCRTNSLTRRLLWLPLEQVRRAVEDDGAVSVDGRALLEVTEPRMTLDHAQRAYVIAGRLHAARSVRPTRIQLSVQPWTIGRTALAVSIPSRTRRLCSRRYFRSAHLALDVLTERFGGATPPSIAVRPPAAV